MVTLRNEDLISQNLIIESIELDKTNEYFGKSLADDYLIIKFTNGRIWVIYDNAQNCCEYRYMVIQDDLTYHAGAQLYSITLGDCVESASNDDIQFLIIKTSKGAIVVSNHNEHNGYYGGFDLVIEDVTGQAEEPSMNLRMRIES